MFAAGAPVPELSGRHRINAWVLASRTELGGGRIIEVYWLVKPEMGNAKLKKRLVIGGELLTIASN